MEKIVVGTTSRVSQAWDEKLYWLGGQYYTKAEYCGCNGWQYSDPFKASSREDALKSLTKGTYFDEAMGDYVEWLRFKYGWDVQPFTSRSK